jgi:hypothetical protein
LQRGHCVERCAVRCSGALRAADAFDILGFIKTVLSTFVFLPQSSTEFYAEFNRGIFLKARLCVLGAQAPSSKQKYVPQ